LATKTRCCIGSDADLLSVVQLEEVVSLLNKNRTKNAIDFVQPGNGYASVSGTEPRRSVRIAHLMKALLDGHTDVLVLDASFLPTKIPNGLTIGAITSRITPYDALISSDESILDELRDEAVLATTTARREAQLLYYRSDLRVVSTTGSLDAVIEKVKSGKIDAAIVAAANMERLNRQDFVTELLTNSVCVPAAGQGALAILVRSSEDQFRDVVQSINDPTSYSTLRAEWSFLEHLKVDNDAPVGVLGFVVGKVLELEGILALPDGREKIHFMVKGKLGDEEDLGQTLATEILDAGGREILQELHLF